jgi:xanthine dehydrogenase accessory factor
MGFSDIDKLLQRLADGGGVLVTVGETQGSVPRETGAWMAVFPDAVVNTIGGGRLEKDAIERAHRWLAHDDSPQPSAMVPGNDPQIHRYALGPSLGQCCGGVVFLSFERIGPADAAAMRRRLAEQHTPVALFGGGHVGRALVEVLAPLPFAVRWIDSRDEIFPGGLPANVTCEHSDPVQASVADLAPHSRVLIMSFSHAEDLDIVAACLQRQRQRGDLDFIGLIGSRTKWATFRHRLQARGFSDEELAQVTCPIGLPGIQGKEPGVIAVSVAAQLLGLR